MVDIEPLGDGGCRVTLRLDFEAEDPEVGERARGDLERFGRLAGGGGAPPPPAELAQGPEDLVGLPAFDREGVEVGTVAGVHLEPGSARARHLSVAIGTLGRLHLVPAGGAVYTELWNGVTLPFGAEQLRARRPRRAIRRPRRRTSAPPRSTSGRHDGRVSPPSPPRRPWSRTERPVPRFLVRPVEQFMRQEAAGGIVLAAATIAALVWANLDAGSYASLWDTSVTLEVGGRVVREDLLHVVNDGLMALFFLVIGLEVKRELTVGELRDPKAASLPFFAAFGGMVAPALIFLALTAGGQGGAGWGIPIATDVAFALAVLAAFGRRVPPALVAFLLGIAVIDDIGAIAVIAVFYTDALALGWLAAAGAGLVAVALLNRIGVRSTTVYVALGLAVWFATFESGVHATIAGVALGLLTPARPFQPPSAVGAEAAQVAREILQRSNDDEADAGRMRRLSWLSKEAISPLDRRRARAAPLVQLCGAADLRAGQRRHRAEPRRPGGGERQRRGGRGGGRPGGRQAAGRDRRHAAGGAPGGGAAAGRRRLGPRAGHRRPGGHRLHRVLVHRRARVPGRPGARDGRPARHPGRLGPRRGPRHRAAGGGHAPAGRARLTGAQPSRAASLATADFGTPS